MTNTSPHDVEKEIDPEPTRVPSIADDVERGSLKSKIEGTEDIRNPLVVDDTPDGGRGWWVAFGVSRFYFMVQHLFY